MIKRFLMTIMVIVTVSLGAGLLSPAQASAACEDSFLTFRPWYYGLIKDRTDCSFKEVNAVGINDSENVDLTVFVWTVILNILSILFNLVGYLALGVLIYGGYLYVLSRGDPTKIAGSKRTIVAAVVGLIICILASLIANTIVTIMTEATTGG